MVERRGQVVELSPADSLYGLKPTAHISSLTTLAPKEEENGKGCTNGCGAVPGLIFGQADTTINHLSAFMRLLLD